jgi:hypothetical protein
VAPRSSSKRSFAERENGNYVRDKKRLLLEMRKRLNLNTNTGGRESSSEGS